MSFRTTSFSFVLVILVSAFLASCYVHRGSSGLAGSVLGRPPVFEDPDWYLVEVLYIGAGNFQYCDEDFSDSTADKTSVSLRAFYMGESEVDNYQYRCFLNDLRRKNDTAALRIAMYDSTQWLNYDHDESMMQLYHWHPAYQHWPAVNISYEGAMLFCEWLTAYYDSLYQKGELKYKYTVSLPNHTQWTYAAMGGYNWYQRFAWPGFGLEDEKGVPKCNYDSTSTQVTWDGKKIPRKHSVGFNKMPGPLKTTAFERNDYGMYNMCGNVAEMTKRSLPKDYKSYLQHTSENSYMDFDSLFAAQFPDKMIAPVKGGSWYHSAKYLDIHHNEPYAGPNPYTGFRIIIQYPYEGAWSDADF